MKYMFTISLVLFISSISQITSEVTMENWMSFLPDDKKLLLINIPGAHNTAAHEMNILGIPTSRTQDKSIPELLNIGVRKLDIRIALRERQDDDDNLYTCHGIFDCYYLDENNNQQSLTFKHILLDIKNFLEKNPTETVILWTQSEKGDGYENLKRAVELLEKIVPDLFVKYDKNLKLGDIRGKIVSTVYKTDNFDSEGRVVYHSGYDGSTDLEEIHRKFVDGDFYNSWEVTGELKVEEVEEFLRTHDISIEDAEEDFENNKSKYPITYFTSCTGEHQTVLPLPKVQAEIVNPFILGYDFKNGFYYGWIDMDYVSLELAQKIINTNFS